MRITQQSMTRSSLTSMQNNLSDLSKTQDQLSSGKVLTKPSDSPTDTSKAMRTRTELASTTQVSRNITDAVSRLNQTDSALSDLQDLLQKVQTLTTQGLNTGAADASSSAALGTEVSSIREAMLGVANTTVAGRPVFGGVTAGSTAYDATTGAYTGTGNGADQDHPVTRRISDSETVRIDVSGPEAFGTTDTAAGTQDLFALVQGIADKLNSYPVDVAALSDDLTALGEAQDRLSTAQATIGAVTNRVEDADSLNTDRQLSLTSQLSALEDVDIASATVTMSAQELSYQASLSVTSKIMQTSLLDFLR